MSVSAVSLANISRDWLDARADVEAYLPPDDFECWPSNYYQFLEIVDYCEEEFKKAIELANAEGIVDDL